MSDQPPIIQLPLLHEHTFPSSVPLVGPIIRRARMGLYWLTAKWSVLSLLGQQNHINQMIGAFLNGHELGMRSASWDLQQLQARMQDCEMRLQNSEARLQNSEGRLREFEMRLQEYEERLIDQDRDLTQVARTVAEVDLRQRYHARTSHAERD